MNARLIDHAELLAELQAELADTRERFIQTLYDLDSSVGVADSLGSAMFDVLTLPRDEQPNAALALIYAMRDRVNAALESQAETLLAQRQAAEDNAITQDAGLAWEDGR